MDALSSAQMGSPGVDDQRTEVTGSDVSGMDMGKEDFLMLFLETLQHQDPNEPMSNSEMMQQMGLFSLMESVENMGEHVDSLGETLEEDNSEMLDRGAAMIGRHVEAETQDGDPVVGEVSSAVISEEGMHYIVDDEKVDVDSINTIKKNAFDMNKGE